MNIHLHIANVNVTVQDDTQLKHIVDILNKHSGILKTIVMTQQEAIDKLNGVATQLAKVKAEVQKLVDAAGNEANISPELQAAIDSVATATQGVDDLNADEQPTEPTA